MSFNKLDPPLIPPLINANSSNRSNESKYSGTLKTYKRRYLVVLTFAFNSMVNAMMWITFAPIQSTSAQYFGVSQGAINFFSLSYMMAYVPGSLLCAYFFKKFYLRKSFIFSSGLQLIGSAIRYFATSHFIQNQNSLNIDHLAYIMVLTGQSMAALAQPFYTNSPARIPAEWFSKEGRDVATAILSIINPLGIGLGSFLPTFFVADDGYHFGGFQGIMLMELICCGVGFILTLLFFYDKPPTSPSMSQKLKRSAIGKRSLSYDLKQIMSNRHFLCLFFGFGIGLGLFNGLTTLINEYTSAFGYNTDDAGNFGGLLIGGGLFGAVVAGVFMEIFRKYGAILKGFTIATVVCMVFLLWQLKPNNLVIVTVLFGVFGFMAVPIVAVTFEAAAECTYPMNEELSSALLMTAGSAFGIVYVVIWGYYLPDNGDKYENQFNFSSYFLVGNGCVMLMFMMLFNGEYKRLNAESQYNKYLNELNEEDISVVESDWGSPVAKNVQTKRPINGSTAALERTPISVNKQGRSSYVFGSADNSVDKQMKYSDSP